MAVILSFGKYKGREVSEIVETDPGYLRGGFFMKILRSCFLAISSSLYRNRLFSSPYA
jgi:hypothetical protein